MITNSRDQCHVPWELENDGCESEFIVGSFDNRICVGVLRSNSRVDFVRYVF